MAAMMVAQWVTNQSTAQSLRSKSGSFAILDVIELRHEWATSPLSADRAHSSEDYLPVGQIDPPFEKSRVPSVINFCQLVMN